MMSVGSEVKEDRSIKEYIVTLCPSPVVVFLTIGLFRSDPIRCGSVADPGVNRGWLSEAQP